MLVHVCISVECSRSSSALFVECVGPPSLHCSSDIGCLLCLSRDVLRCSVCQGTDEIVCLNPLASLWNVVGAVCLCYVCFGRYVWKSAWPACVGLRLRGSAAPVSCCAG